MSIVMIGLKIKSEQNIQTQRKISVMRLDQIMVRVLFCAIISTEFEFGGVLFHVFESQ